MQDLLKFSCFQSSKNYFQIATNWLNTTNGNGIKQHSFYELLNLIRFPHSKYSKTMEKMTEVGDKSKITFVTGCSFFGCFIRKTKLSSG